MRLLYPANPPSLAGVACEVGNTSVMIVGLYESVSIDHGITDLPKVGTRPQNQRSRSAVYSRLPHAGVTLGVDRGYHA